MKPVRLKPVRCNLCGNYEHLKIMLHLSSAIYVDKGDMFAEITK